MDNLVVFVLIFKQFKTPTELQHRALLYGVLLSIALRVVFIFFGTWLLARFRVCAEALAGVITLSCRQLLLSLTPTAVVHVVCMVC